MRNVRAEFESELDNLIVQADQDPSVDEYDFRGFRFPELRFDLWRRSKHLTKKLNLTEAEFVSKVDFFEQSFPEFVDFTRAHFKDLADFRSVSFGKGACFLGAAFSRGARFDQAQFNGTTQFLRTRFEKAPAYFFGASFKEVTFSWAHFEKDAIFFDCKFPQGARFVYATFQEGAEFRDTEFAGMADFSGSTFLGECTFRSNKRSPPLFKELDFGKVNFGKDRRVVFDGVNLEHASFLDTDLQIPRFSGITWPRRTYLKYKRQHLADDQLNMALDQAGKVEENYRQLILNFEAHRNYSDAEDFYVGEMEMRRRRLWNQKPRILWQCLGHEIYRFCSAYGTSYPRAACVFLLGLIFFSCLTLLTGFRIPASPNQPAGPVIRYILTWHLPPRHLAVDFFRAIFLCLPGRLGPFEPDGDGSRIVVSFATIYLTAQLAIFLLAVRRTFKR
jgi:uncharacterized protein YjbI with pentapeptide repeats